VASDRDFWGCQDLSGSTINLPFRDKTDQQRSYVGSRVAIDIPTDLSNKLTDMIKYQHSTTEFSFFLGAYYIFLRDFCNQKTLSVGIATSLRKHYMFNDSVGMFVNSLPASMSIPDNSTFSDFIKSVSNKVKDIYIHNGVSLADIVDGHSCGLDSGSLYETMFLYESDEKSLSSFCGGQIERRTEEALNDNAKFPLTLSIRKFESGKYRVEFEYDTSQFEKKAAEIFCRGYLELIKQISESSDGQVDIGSLRVINCEEENKLLSSVNNIDFSYSEQTVIDIFLSYVYSQPEAIAVRGKSGVLSYSQVNKLSSQLASWINENISEDSKTICVKLSRDIYTLPALLGVLRAGKIYVPIDPDYPEDRVDYIIDDSGSIVTLVDDFTSQKAESSITNFININEFFCNKSQIDEHVDVDYNLSNVDSAAYVIYTSGSTGKPKGVKIGHRAFSHYCQWACENYIRGVGVGSLVHSSLAFDLTITSLFSPICCGKEVHMISDEDGVLGLVEALNNCHDYSLIKITPAHLKILKERVSKSTLGKITSCFVIGGEALYLDDMDDLLTYCSKSIFINEYGPTEATVGAMNYVVDKSINGLSNSIPIGSAIGNYKIYLLDYLMRPTPHGVVGEIYISGVGLAESYWNNDMATSERFIPNPYADGDFTVKCYKTGDVAKFIDYDTMHYIGRIDEQVKLNGYRIELGEIEAVYNAISCVKDSVATIENGSLCFNLLLRDGENVPHLSTLKNKATKYLPYYMRPVHYFVMSYVPLTQNGKVDRKQLENGSVKRDRIVNLTRKKTLTDLDLKLLGIWKSILKNEDVNVDDDFFALGGDSLIAIKLVSSIRALGYKFSAKELYLQQSIFEISKHLSSQDDIEIVDVNESIDGDVPLTPIQDWFFNSKFPDQNRYLQLLPIRLPNKYSAEEVRGNVETVFSMIDAARIRYESIGNIVRQFYVQSGDSDNFKYGVIDSDITETNESDFIRIYDDINVFSGPLFSVRHFRSPNNNDALLIVAHHLVVDAYSLSTIKDMLSSVFLSQEVNKGPSYKTWSNALQKYASDPSRQDSYLWNSYVDQNNIYNRYFNDNESISNDESNATRIEAFPISEELHLLSKSLNIGYGDILLLALSRTIFEVLPDIDTCPVTLESVGRADLNPSLDFSRTIGWFTCLYPIVISKSKTSTDELSQIRGIHRLRSEVFNLGVGFMMKDGYTLPPICFNYLGDMSTTVGDNDLVELPVQFLPEPVSLDNKKSSEFLLEVNSWLEKKSLIVSFNIKNGNRSPDKVFWDLFRGNVMSLFSDLSKYNLGVGHKIRNYIVCSNHVASLAECQNISNIYPLLPGQDIMFNQFCNNEESQGFRTHAFCEITSVEEVSNVNEVFKTIVNRLKELRVCFIDDVDSSCQISFTKVDSEFHVIYIDDIYSSDKLSQHIYRHFPEQFNLKSSTQIRCVVLSYYDRLVLCLDHHHIIIDGASVRLIFSLIKLGLRSHALLDDALSSLKGYEDYFLLNTPDRQLEVKGFWASYLEGFSGVMALPGATGKQTLDKPVDIEKAVVMCINENICRQVREVSQGLKVTVSSIFQQSWSALLSKELDIIDVTFGLITSGRSSLKSSDDYVGMYMNIVPVRVKQDHRLTSSKITGVHDDIQSIIEHDSISVRELSHSLPIESGKQIYNTLYTFENIASGQDIDEVKFSTCTSSPISLVVKWGEQTPQLVLTYDSEIFNKQYMVDLSNKLLEQLKRDLLMVREEEMENNSSSLVTCFGEVNSSEDVVVLIHGAASGLEVFSRMISCLNVPVVGLDSLNFNTGSSGHGNYVDDIESLANIYWSQIKGYLIDKRVSFVGFSQGGLIVSAILNLALKEGSNISHVFLLDSFYLNEEMKYKRESLHRHYVRDLSLNSDYMGFSELNDEALINLSNIELKSLLNFSCNQEFNLDVTLIKASIFDGSLDDEYNEFLSELVSTSSNGWDEIFRGMRKVSLPTTHLGLLKDNSKFIADLINQSALKNNHSGSIRAFIDEK